MFFKIRCFLTSLVNFRLREDEGLNVRIFVTVLNDLITDVAMNMSPTYIGEGQYALLLKKTEHLKWKEKWLSRNEKGASK